MSVFKAYDIRGIYNKEYDKDVVYKIGFFLPRLLQVNEIYIGRDDRISSPEIFKYLSQGITDAGANVVDLGQTTTPAVYFATAHFNAQASVQITASHNPKEYNGLKISRAKAIPVGGETGLKELEQLVLTQEVTPVTDTNKGKIIAKDIKNDYIQFLQKFVPTLHGLRIGIDYSNGMASLYVPELLKERGAEIHAINQTIDGSFPSHEPNPLEEKNLVQIIDLVKREKLDLGIIYDGDADRAMFIDEKGQFIRPDIITAVLANALGVSSGENVLVDIRTSRGVSEYLQNQRKANVNMWKVGHAFAKLKLKEINAVVGGELAGHYYFRDFFNCDSGILASLLVLKNAQQVKTNEHQPISAIIQNIDIYANSGEINFVINAKTDAIAALKAYATAISDLQATLDFDGYRFEYPNWWFNVRSSNTEPYLRIVMEANDQATLSKHLDEVKAILGKFS
ncbi:phosphomannomutase/phosphoglucomutase [Entomospira culicis]|uniref:Phosphomannomutase/phosphoglucomutase n=1 Tax=Entomospira culicis TaxID=2719989 RepID=A0A968KVK8_9SPIO|nr:phosphomannomutase/phosphoglucomutase [Entomospira culicis]NIZ19018.1 phosphomannomutase/phosphoglucomutase [Entomospira culicis]NIZ69233.1 phosphomannomutase/phosphoglucomutase [Entomospira culicis]WDI37817.1 phosphomannomutase/phosphoglucomutase [Entomospira culicis]WDI39445.1 phosphomannomutase/phosphoglucomutase [Entomospira culicis]